MKELHELFRIAARLVNDLGEELNYGNMGLDGVEQRVLEFVNQVGQQMVQQVAEQISEPVVENNLWVGDQRAQFNKVSNLRLITRFGGELVISRRYYSKEGGGGYCPVDEKLGVKECVGFTPLMSYLLCLYGGCESYEAGAHKLSETLGFGVSSTGVQRNTEKVGARIDSSPYERIGDEKQGESCETMVVEIDGTMSPQIREQEGITGRESLKQLTEYKECNVVVIEKHNSGEALQRWTGACYGPREGFEEYVRKAGLKMGQLKAERVAFLGDGAHSNWEIQKTNFPGAIAILDFYHATEHLSDFCEYTKGVQEKKLAYDRWTTMLIKGEYLQVLEEMRGALDTAVNRERAQKELNYFLNNKNRIDYAMYREAGLPIGSGLVEGSCKFVVGKRFKGSGMRWKKQDNASTLEVRLAIINNTLRDRFQPGPQKWRLVA
jgi:hypothetical protein